MYRGGLRHDFLLMKLVYNLLGEIKIELHEINNKISINILQLFKNCRDDVLGLQYA